MIDIDRELDLRGEVCPYTFVKAKLETEDMPAGQVLRILLDHPPAVEDVPRSLTTQGDQVLLVRQLGDTEWEVLVRVLEKG
jgi:tRNA 2-thiouridine synthesizing protein A